MGDIAFTFDADTGHSDIKVVGGDFLICDKKAIDVSHEVTNVPTTIKVFGTGLGNIDGIWTYSYEDNGRGVYLDPLTKSENLFWDNGAWILYDDLGGQTWTNVSDSISPPMSGWPLGSLGDPAPTLHYDTTEKTKEYFESSLQTAVEISLFSDKRASTSEAQKWQVGIEGRQSRRGYWANTFKEYAQGSGLWLLQREKKTEETLSRAKTYCNNALKWLVTDGVVKSVSAETNFDGNKLIILVSIIKPDGQEAGFKYDFAWDGIGG